MFTAAMLAASLALNPAQSAQIDAVVEQVMRANHIAGLSIGIGRKGSVLFLRGYGVRDNGAYALADGDTIYRIGSITKQFTAALVLQQIESARMSFSAPVHGATVQQLMAQTSGIPDYAPGTSVEAALAAPPLFAAGTQWAYSNTNYYLLGTLLQTATGTTYPKLLWEKIVSPLHLRATSFAVPKPGDVAVGYEWSDGAYVPVHNDYADDPSYTFSAAAMSSSARDLLSWLDDLSTGKVVSASSFDDMTSSKITLNGERTRYGYGFFTRNWYGWKTAEHSGYVDGFSSDDAIVLDDGLEMAVLANADSVSLVPLSKSIVAILLPAKDQNAVADIGSPAQNESASVTADVQRELQLIQNKTPDKSIRSVTIDPGFENLGIPSLVEFIERNAKAGVTYEKYRLSYAYSQFWLTLGYGSDGKIMSLSIAPDED